MKADRTDYKFECTPFSLPVGIVKTQVIEKIRSEKSHNMDNPNPQQTGLIYMITNTVDSVAYIGQTSGPLHRRWTQHRCAANKFIEALNDPIIDPEYLKTTKLYAAMAHHGVVYFHCQVILGNIPLEKLDEEETRLIALHNTYFNGYNMTPGGKGFSGNVVRVKRYEESQGAVMYVHFAHYNGDPYICIQYHPRCKGRFFIISDPKKVSQVRETACMFLADLEASNITYTSKRAQKAKDGVIKPGICVASKKGVELGYRVQVRYGPEGKYDQSFVDTKLDMETKLILAERYLKLVHLDMLMSKYPTSGLLEDTEDL